jgi:steroid delta-isomerase-like uncharacterized protein
MSAENETIVRRFFDEVCNDRQLDVADELFVPDHVYHDPQIPGTQPGPEGMKQTIGTYQLAFPDAHWEVVEMLSAGDRVVTRWIGSGTHGGELMGIAPTGREVSVPGHWIHHVEDGRIVESWNVWDTLGILQQLGVVPSPG